MDDYIVTRERKRLHLICQFETDSWAEPFLNGSVPLNNF